MEISASGNLAIIPARGGSKRIPGKNSRLFLGKPIIAYSIEAALNSGLFEEVMVSTDDDTISSIAIQYGAKVPFFRSPDTSNDFAGLAEVVEEVLLDYREKGRFFSRFCCILPTAPLIRDQDLKEGLSKLELPEVDGALSLCKFSYPVQRALRLVNGQVSLMDETHRKTRSQDLEPAFHDAGMWYWIRVEAFWKFKSFFLPRLSSIEIPPWRVQDIDNEDDWKLAELKFSLIQNLGW